jgi:hypothetical protein
MSAPEQDDAEAKRLIDSLGFNDLKEGAIAIKTMVDNLVEAGMTEANALFWSAVHTAALSKMPEVREEDFGG